MQFVHPGFLFALAAVAIPIIIHLFHFRRYKKIVFSDIRFLKQVQEQNKSKQKIKDLLVLLCRILSIAFLVFAFAQPFIPLSENTQVNRSERTVSIYVDNSFSMNNEGTDGILLETAKEKARSVIGAYGNDDRFQVITNDAEGRHQQTYNKTEALQLVDEIQPSSSVKTLSEIEKKQLQATRQTTQPLLYFISDFQQHSSTFGEMKNDSGVSYHFLPVKASVQKNISIDSAWLASPVLKANENIRLLVRIRNNGEENAEAIAVSLKLNGTQKAIQNVDCDAGSYKDIELQLTLADAGWQQGEISLIDHPVVFDDKLFIILKPDANSKVLSLYADKPGKYIQAVFASDPSFVLTQTLQTQIDFSTFKDQQLIVLNEPRNLGSGLADELQKFVAAGGNLLIVPSASATQQDIHSLNELCSRLGTVSFSPAQSINLKADHINTSDAVFKDVFLKVPRNLDLPAVKQYYTLTRNNRSRGNALITLNNGNALIWQSTYQKGRVYTLAVPLNEAWSNLQQHAVFVPFMLKTALGSNKNSRLFYTLGQDEWISLPASATDKLLRIHNKKQEIVTDLSVRNGEPEAYVDHQLQEAGIYEISGKESNKPVSFSAFNYPRTESSMKFFDKDDLVKLTSGFYNASIDDADAKVLQQQIKQELSGKQLWRWFVMLSLLFVICEILLIKLLK